MSQQTYIKNHLAGRIALERIPKYAPCGYLVCRVWYAPDGALQWNGFDDLNTVLVDSDWDYPALAQSFGWDIRGESCPHEPTDGTVACRDCGKTVTDFITEASDYLDSIAGLGRTVEDPGYFSESEVAA